MRVFVMNEESERAALAVLDNSELTFLTASFEYDGQANKRICCLVDSHFTPDHFQRLCLFWQEKYDLGPLFISRPRLSKHGSILGRKGRVYKNGKEADTAWDDPTLLDIGGI